MNLHTYSLFYLILFVGGLQFPAEFYIPCCTLFSLYVATCSYHPGYQHRSLHYRTDCTPRSLTGMEGWISVVCCPCLAVTVTTFSVISLSFSSPSSCFLQCWQLLTCSLLSATDWKMSSHQSLSFKHFQSACQVLTMVVGVQMCRGMSHGSSTPYTSLVCSYYMSLIRFCKEVGNLDSSA